MGLLPPLEIGIIISTLLIIIALVCYYVGTRKPLSRKETKELEELNRILLEPYRPKEYNTESKTDLKEL